MIGDILDLASKTGINEDASEQTPEGVRERARGTSGFGGRTLQAKDSEYKGAESEVCQSVPEEAWQKRASTMENEAKEGVWCVWKQTLGDPVGQCQAFGLSDKDTTRGLSEVTYSKLEWLMIPLELY